MKPILGSASPRRKELLARLVGSFDIRVSDANEACSLAVPSMRAMYTAGQKALAIEVGDDELLICADTIVWCDGRFLGKPKDEQDADEMLRFLNNKINVVYTGVCLRTKNSLDFFCAASGVKIAMTQEEIDRYVASGCPMDKAGAYGIQDPLLNATLVYGSLSNVIGLPLEALQDHLRRMGL